MYRLLAIEDNEDDFILLKMMLYDNPSFDFKIENAVRLTDGLEKLSSQNYDVVLLDLHLPDSEGMDTYESIIKADIEIPVIILSGLDDVAKGVEAVEKGAQDFLVKGRIDAGLLERSIKYAVERSAITKKLIHQEKKLYQAEKQEILNYLSAGLAHNLHNPLSGITGTIQVLEKKGLVSDDIRRQFTNIKESAIRMASILNDLFQLMDTGAAPMQSLNLSDILAHSIRTVTNLFTEKDFIIHQKLEPDLMLQGSASEIHLAFISLLSNAAESIAQKGFISVQLVQSGEQAEIIIEDNGQGIPPDVLDKVFIPFYTTKEPAKAKGIGLNVVRRIVERHGGVLQLSSKEAEGTNVSIQLPLIMSPIRA